MSFPHSIELKKTLHYWQNFAPCLGTNVTIYDSEHGYWNAASGLSAVSPNIDFSENESCYIYSITKTFTAIVILNLIERKLIQLDDPIIKHLSNFNFPESVTIKHLLNHTSGVPSYTDLNEYMPAIKSNPGTSWSFDSVIEKTCIGQLDFEPGEKWHYSNTGYMILLMLIEKITGESYESNVNKIIINKIGLNNSYVAQEINKSTVTNGYSRDLNIDEKLENISNLYDPWWCKTGLIVSTSLDITKLYKNLFTGKLLNDESLTKMTKARPINIPAGPHFNKPSYGLGLMIDPENKFGISYGHGGDGPGFNTWSVTYPNFNNRVLIITVFCNTSMGGHPLYFVNDLLNILKAG